MIRKITTAHAIRVILDDAIEYVSDGHSTIYSARNLFYAVRQFFLTRFFRCPGITHGMVHYVCEASVKLLELPDIYICEKGHVVRGEDLEPIHPELKWYKKYDSFTQDFLRTHEKIHGKLQGIYREARGEYVWPHETGSSHVRKIGGINADGSLNVTRFISGIGNKLLLVEKNGIHGILMGNRFDHRLDAAVLSTEGFSIEQARELLVQAEKQVPIVVLHDFDINGLLIVKTLTKPTKRLDIHVEKVVDLGLDWTSVQKITQKYEITPEPVELRKCDIAKLDGLHDRGEIAEDEYQFLLGRTTPAYDAWKHGEKTDVKTVLARGFRVEIQQLRPSELIAWLEERLEELDLWKTVPDQDELDDHMHDEMDVRLEDTKRILVRDLKEAVEDKIGLSKILLAIGHILRTVENKLTEEISKRMEDIEYPTEDVDDFVEAMRKDMVKYWTILAKEIAAELAEELKESVWDEVERDREEIIGETEEDDDVVKDRRNLAEEMRIWIEESGD